MNSTWRSLFWKEWREQRAVALAILVVLLMIPPLTTLVELGDLYAGLSGTLLLAVPFFALFVGMGIAAGEQSRGTIPFLRALPTSSWNAALVKLTVAIASLTISIVVALAFYYLYNLAGQHFSGASVAGTGLDQDLFPPVWGISDFFINSGTASCLMAVSIVCWTAASGVNRRDEISAGAIAGATIAGAYLLMGIGSWLTWKISPALRQALQPLAAAFPGRAGLVSAREALPNSWNLAAYFLTAAAVAVLSHAAVVWWFVTRYGRVVPGKTESATPTSAVTAAQSWLNAPRHSIFTALVWKQFRELFAIVAIGMAVIVSIALVVSLAKISNGESIRDSDFYDIPFGAWYIIGGMIAIVIGVGVFLEDLKPGLYNFWRSRPTPIDLWFWTKFASGWLACLAPVCIPLLGWGLQGMLFYGVDTRWSVSMWDANQPGGAIAVGLLIHTGFYCSAVLAMSVLRRPVIAAVSVPPLLIGTLVLLGKIGEWADIPEPGVLLFSTLCLLLCVVAAILAWQAIRRNWSLERFMT